jgi:hypothetical protein
MANIPTLEAVTTPAELPPNLQPPDEQFWKRYSPNSEFPIAWLLSFTAHFVILVLVSAILMNWFNWGADTAPVPFEVVEVGGGGDGGSGGAAAGQRQPKEVIAGTPEEQQNPSEKPPELPAVKPLDVSQLPIQLQQDPSTRSIARTQATDRLSQLDQALQNKLLNGAMQNGNNGNAKSGNQSGKGEGNAGDPGQAAAGRAGNGTATAKRQMRWTMTFATADGRDYVRQLKTMRAIIAFPKSNGETLVFRNLTSPYVGKVEDVGTIKRMYWIDNNPGLMQQLRFTLNLNFTPTQVIAFFPDELEKRLLAKELAYRGLREEQIQETFFKITVGITDYDVTVYQQIAVSGN